MIYVQKAHQTQDNERMVDKPNAHHAWFPDQKETSFLEERETLSPAPAMMKNQIAFVSWPCLHNSKFHPLTGTVKN